MNINLYLIVNIAYESNFIMLVVMNLKSINIVTVETYIEHFIINYYILCLDEIDNLINF